MKKKLLLIAALIALSATAVPAEAASARSCTTLRRDTLAAAARARDVGCVLEMVAAAKGGPSATPALRVEMRDLFAVIICPFSASLAPGIVGLVDITPEGDITILAVGPFYDCPPFGNLFR